MLLHQDDSVLTHIL